MADEEAGEPTRKQNRLFKKLKEFAEICCENTDDIKTHGDDCRKIQLGYWVYHETGKEWSWKPFDPTDAKGRLTEVGKEMCGIKRSGNKDYPLFSYVSGRVDNEAHTEAQLLPRMRERAGKQTKRTSFFLWTTNSPCGRSIRPKHDCQNNIFKFVATNLINRYRHRLDVGFIRWFSPSRKKKEEQVEGASTEQYRYMDRTGFCQDVESLKSAKYTVQGRRGSGTIDFQPYLAFWKIDNQKTIKNKENIVVSDNEFIKSIGTEC